MAVHIYDIESENCTGTALCIRLSKFLLRPVPNDSKMSVIARLYDRPPEINKEIESGTTKVICVRVKVVVLTMMELPTREKFIRYC